ncbi:arabinose efflux permease [Paucilactobacillus vaccinostercus DSM 20634]|uniref:Arabinose efflux permease n=1 Tax=Paucilactobacillus vaccinostercus DSM 20634 TaxID=1423813 RepID=A0A0R2A1X1_9LACO|nr:arabinose efflux permease [Paucilactobacillus vaccinostercus DSM 20634]
MQSIVFVLTAFMLGCNEFIMIGIISDIAHQFNVSIAVVGYLVTIFATVYAISTPLITIFTNRFNRFKTLMVLMLVFLIGNTATALAPNYFMLVVARMVTAAVAGSIISLIMTFASSVAPMDKRPALISWIFSGFSIASVFGVPIGTAISTAYGWRNAFLIVSVISVLTLGLLFWLLPRQIKQVTSSLGKQLSLMKDLRVYDGVVLVLFGAAAMYGYYTYIRPLLTTELGFSLSSLNWLLFLLGLMSIFSNQLSGQLASHGGLVHMPKVYILEIALLFILPLTLHLAIFGLVVLLVLSLITSVLNSPIQLHFLNVAEQDYPQSIVLASSLNSIFFNFGISLGSATSSTMVDVAGVHNISFGAGVFALIALVMVVLLNRAIKRYQQASRSHDVEF